MSPFEYALLITWMILVLWVIISALVRDFTFPVSKIDHAFPSKEREEQLKLLSEEDQRPHQVCE